jgi:glycosyltransferase involved in cell wall biosynthesis
MNPASPQPSAAATLLRGDGCFAAGLVIDAWHHPMDPRVSKPEMKLLVLAQTPPPLHGQSVMVQALVSGLPKHGFNLHHVNLRLSQDTADIGRWRMGKILETLAYAVRTVRARFKHRCDTLYYVPAPPAKRGALYRDWVLMLLLRPFFRHCIFHWHAGGLGEWIETRGVIERFLTHWLLGRVDLSIVLANKLRTDAEILRSKRIAVVANGVPTPSAARPRSAVPPFRLFFLGLCSEEKGLFDAASAVLEANRQVAGGEAHPAFDLTVAGPFDRASTADRCHRLCGEHPNVFRYVGKVGGAQKSALFGECHALLFPTRYPAETFSLVALEALAHDRPVVATKWRGLPEIVTPEVGILVPPGEPSALAAALLQIREDPPASRICRARFLSHFTLEHHLTALAAAIRSLE